MDHASGQNLAQFCSRISENQPSSTRMNGPTMNKMPSMLPDNIIIICSQQMYETGSKWLAISISIQPLKTSQNITMASSQRQQVT